MGQSRVALGVNMQATCRPNSDVMGGMPEEAVLYFGIIDILQVRECVCVCEYKEWIQSPPSTFFHTYESCSPPSLLSLPCAQSYVPSKRLEHRLKALVHDSHSISVTDPIRYSKRFQDFMKKVFVQ